jgi:mono/diheme cytochrome c family protein
MKSTLLILLAAAPALAVEFDQDIRPLLQQHCVECHGEKKQKGELRLDAKIFAFKGGHDGMAIIAGDTAKSLLFQRINSTDDDERMPPKGKPLSSAQIALVQAWITEGAVWPENAADKAAAVDKRLQHWSVQPVRAVTGASIDSLINAKLAEKNLAMSPPADRRTLIRRLSFDLVGLPPTPERVEQFVNDSDPKAYEKLVDELLHSTHYGERWARHWLDIAHYADTHGFERDQLRPNAWRYRDYVIASLNADKPYDQFIREQIAGDVIAPNDPQSVIATGFLAAGPWDYVGHVETKSDMLKRAARAGDLDDMVTQVITSTMGITINCARCHDHKLDPIKQEEYYRLWAVFAGVKRGDREVDIAEAKRIASEKTRLTQELASTRAQIAKLAGDGLDLADMVGAGVKGRGIDLRNGNLTTGKLGYHRDIQTNRLQRIEWPAEVKDTDRFVLSVFVPDGRNPVPIFAKQEVSGLPATSGHTWDVIRNGPLNAQRSTKIGGVDYAEKDHSILGLHANSGITFDLSKIRESGGLGVMHLTAALGFGADVGAAASRADFTVYVDAERKFQKLKLRKDEFTHLDIGIPATAKTLTLIATDGGDGIGSDLLFLGDARLVPDMEHSKISAADQEQLKHHRAQAVKLDASLKALPDVPKVYATVSDAQPPPIQVQRRGNSEDLQQEVQPGAFAWARHASMDFGTKATPEGQRRRMLADWITHPDNPLTRRVLVNRLWHHHFGLGLVTTPSDFGLGGDKPTHPELLDWLADEFLRSGWSVKHMHKLIVMSAAYQQQSTSKNDTARRLDAQNRLLWRQNPRRLDAESVHDSVLSIAGTLNTAIGGPGYRDFNFTEAYAPLYDYITPDKPDLLRRSIYRFVVRTTPHQFMSTLDCPDPANLTPARAQTTTALQALTLSNNEFMLQQASNLATRIENETDSREAGIRRAFLLCLQRAAKPDELSAATHLVAERGLFALCRMLINTNEFVYID